MSGAVLRHTLRGAAVLAILLAIPAGAIVALVIVFEFPGGMPSSYRAVDHDLRLTPLAREAAPFIQAIDRYYEQHAECPRGSESDLEELRASLPPTTSVVPRGRWLEFRAAGGATGWLYYSGGSDPTSCTLSRKLGWDPALVWLRRHEQTKWIFVPDDGSPDITIKLDAGGRIQPR